MASATTINLSTQARGILPAASEPAHTGDVTNTAGSLAMTAKGLNGTLLSGLATGILKNTTSTGVPTIAVAGTDYAGIGTANSFTVLQTMQKGFAETVTGSAALATGGTIAIAGPVTTVTPTAAVTGVILTSGTTAGQVQMVLNTSAFSVTFAAVATSHVADGTSDVIAATTAREFIWNGTSWYRKG